MTTIAIFDSAAGYELNLENVDIFEGADLRAATLAALADHGLTSAPDAISVYSGKAYITEYDGDRFWIQLLCDYLGDDFEWGYGETVEEALESVA